MENTFIAICGVLSVIAIFGHWFALKIAAGFGWLAFLVWWLTDPPVVKGTPSDVAVIGVLLFLGIIFLLWAFVSRGTVDIDVELPSSFGGKVIKYPKRVRRSELETPPDGLLDYKLTVRRAARPQKAKK